MRAGDADRMAATAGTFFDQHEFGVKIVGERNYEKKEDHRADEGAPFAPRGVTANAVLAGPPSAPENHSGDGDREPENI